jgi:hypothetical protein
MAIVPPQLKLIMDPGTNDNPLVAFVKRLGLIKTILIVLILVFGAVPFLGLLQFFYQCVLLIGDGCDL